MNDSISQQDIQRLAKVSCEMVNQLDFAETGNLERVLQPMRKLLSTLLSRYRHNELLFDALAAISCKPMSKLDIYTVTRDIVRLARETPEAITMVPASMLVGRHARMPVPAHVS